MRTVEALRCVLAAELSLPLIHPDLPRVLGRERGHLRPRGADAGDRGGRARAGGDPRARRVAGDQGRAAPSHRRGGRARDLRRADLLRRRPAVLGSGPIGHGRSGARRADRRRPALAPDGARRVLLRLQQPVRVPGDHARGGRAGPAGALAAGLARGLFRTIGTPDVPLFVQSPEKRRRTMLDLDRQAARAGLPFHFPARLPDPHGAAAAGHAGRRLASGAGARAGDGACGPRTATSAIPQWWRRSPTRSGSTGRGLVAAAETPEIKQALMTSTAAAEAAGVFGVPTFVVRPRERGPQLYWGADRLTLAAAAASGDVSAM